MVPSAFLKSHLTVVTSRYCVNYCSTAKRLGWMCTHIYTHIHTHIPFFIFFSIMVYHRLFSPNFFFLFVLFYWCIVDLQCCVSFRFTAKRFSLISVYIFTCIYTYTEHTCTYGASPGAQRKRIHLQYRKIAGEMGSIPGLGRSPAGGNGNPLQYSCLEISMGRGTWPATVHGAAKSRTWLISWGNNKQHETCEKGIIQKCAQCGFFLPSIKSPQLELLD